jgi:uncharacterized protein (DUF2336 family)
VRAAVIDDNQSTLADARVQENRREHELHFERLRIAINLQLKAADLLGANFCLSPAITGELPRAQPAAPSY